MGNWVGCVLFCIEALKLWHVTWGKVPNVGREALDWGCRVGPEQQGLRGDVKVVDHLPSSSCGTTNTFSGRIFFSWNISSDPNLKIFLISPAKVIEYLYIKLIGPLITPRQGRMHGFKRFIVITRFKGFWKRPLPTPFGLFFYFAPQQSKRPIYIYIYTWALWTEEKVLEIICNLMCIFTRN